MVIQQFFYKSFSSQINFLTMNQIDQTYYLTIYLNNSYLLRANIEERHDINKKTLNTYWIV